jgi:polar amino acid transport system substrate-binding protein
MSSSPQSVSHNQCPFFSFSGSLDYCLHIITMKRVLFAYIFFCVYLLELTPSLLAQEKVITLEGDSWPPYVMDPAGGRNGFMVDMAVAALAQSGYEVKYKDMPWSRALEDTEKGKTDGAVGIYYSDALHRKFIVPTEEMGISINKFFVRGDSAWTYTGTRSLKQLRLGVIDDYDYGEINDYIHEQRTTESNSIDVVFGDNALEKNIKKLLLGRIDATIEDQIVISFVSSRMGVADQIKEAGTCPPANKVGIAFSPENPLSTEYARALSEGIVQLRKSGELQKILDKYGVKDWK